MQGLLQTHPDTQQNLWAWWVEKPGSFEASALRLIAGKQVTYMDEVWLEKANKWQRHQALATGHREWWGLW